MKSETNIRIGDKSYFNIFIGKRILRKDLESLKNSTTAVIPLFSANVHKPFGFIEQSNIGDFSKHSILRGIDGDFDFSIQKPGNIFATTDHCGCINVLDSNIDPNYLLYKLLIAKSIYSFDRSLRSNLKNMSTIEIKIPTKENGEFDIEKQKEIAEKYQRLEKIKDKIKTIKEDLTQQSLKLEETWNGKMIKIGSLFDLNRGKSIYTKKYGDANKGSFPVYSAGKEKLTSINTYDFDGEFLTWATNGFAGFLKTINGKFSINSDRGIFIPKTEDIDINFIKYNIQVDLRNITKGRVGDKGKNEFTKLSPNKIEDNISVKIPTKENGEFDIEKQKEIAEKYQRLEKIKNNLVEELEYLEKVKVEI